MQLYHNSDACWNAGKKKASKSKSKNKNKNKNGKSTKKGYKWRDKSKQQVIPSKPRKPAVRKKNKTSSASTLPSPPNKNLSNKNRQFLKGLGLKVKQSVENC